jgi:hypothetical protein
LATKENKRFHLGPSWRLKKTRDFTLAPLCLVFFCLCSFFACLFGWIFGFLVFDWVFIGILCRFCPCWTLILHIMKQNSAIHKKNVDKKRTSQKKKNNNRILHTLKNLILIFCRSVSHKYFALLPSKVSNCFKTIWVRFSLTSAKGPFQSYSV